MAQLKAHQFAEAIPEMTPAEYSDLKADLKANGQRVPIIIYQDEILDGRNRYRACKELRIEPKATTFKGTEMEAASLVISLNIKRRHLTVGQRSTIGVNTLLPVMKEQAKERHRGKEIREPKNRRSKSDEGKATTQVAKAVGVSRAAVEQAVFLCLINKEADDSLQVSAPLFILVVLTKRTVQM